MSDVIKLLPDNIANQIAAGEVIQRPASVVKELVENAIDAGSTKIDINIKDAGRTLIQVVDNGKGMSASDAVLCFERHATSKVKTAQDLFALSTKGFRGEALASVAAIAHVEMRTKESDTDVGYSVTIEGSKIQSKEEVVCPNGTSFLVKNLFYNVPARRNFLKKDATEFRHIQDEFDRITLAHPDIQFTLTHNDSEIYVLSSEILRKRVSNILGKNSNELLVPISEETEIVKVTGFVVKPEASRKTRGDQYLFVNNRFFKSTYFNHAISKAFEGLIQGRSYPGYFIYLEVDPSKIDVNVHPTKTEIKFEEDKYIYAILFSSIKQALGKYNIVPTLDFEAETSFEVPHHVRKQDPVEPQIRVNKDYNPFNQSATVTPSRSQGVKSTKSSAISAAGFGSSGSSKEWQNFYTIEEEVTSENEALFPVENELPQQYLLKGSYIIFNSKEGLKVINWRRAIERIVYEDISRKFISQPLNSQRLLFPFDIEVSRKECALWMENSSILKQMGFEGQVDGKKVGIEAIPAVLQEESIQGAIESVFEGLNNEQLEKGDLAHHLLSSISSAAGLCQHNLSTKESVHELITQLNACENGNHTPRNKKITSAISLNAIQDLFI